MAGPADNADPHLARDGYAEMMIGYQPLGGDRTAPTAPWGREDALGTDPRSARGSMWGETLGETARTQGEAPAVKLGDFAAAPLTASYVHGCRLL